MTINTFTQVYFNNFKNICTNCNSVWNIPQNVFYIAASKVRVAFKFLFLSHGFCWLLVSRHLSEGLLQLFCDGLVLLLLGHQLILQSVHLDISIICWKWKQKPNAVLRFFENSYIYLVKAIFSCFYCCFTVHLCSKRR